MLILGRPQNEDNCVWISPGRAGASQPSQSNRKSSNRTWSKTIKALSQKSRQKPKKRKINGQKRTSNWRPTHTDFHFPAERKALADLRIVFQSGILHPLGPAHSHALRNALEASTRRLSLAVVLIGLIIGFGCHARAPGVAYLS